jgi:translocator protein
MSKNKFPKLDVMTLAICLALPILAGLAGSLFTFSEINTWYAALEKPFFNPPNWIFGPVWSLLYILMGVSLYLIATSKSKEKREIILVFVGQLILNAGWSIIFFGAHNLWLAAIEIVLLWLTIAVLITMCHKVSLLSARLLYPYLAWVTFATALNFAVASLN